MSEVTETETAIEPTGDETPPVTELEGAPALDAGTEKWMEFARLWESRARKNTARADGNEEKAKRFDEYEEANKTEAEKLQARAEAAENALAERDQKDEQERLVAEVADDKKVPAAILRGATREELEEHADAYLASLPAVPTAPSSEGLGNVGDTVNGSDPGIDAAIAAAQKARNFPLVITLKQQKAALKG